MSLVCANNNIVRAIVLFYLEKGDPLGDSPLATKRGIAIPHIHEAMAFSPMAMPLAYSKKEKSKKIRALPALPPAKAQSFSS